MISIFHLESEGRQEAIDARADALAILRSLSRPLNELVIPEWFTIDEVISQSGQFSFTPESEQVACGRQREYLTGYSSRMVLKVRPHSNNPVRTIHFRGYSPVRGGDVIIAKIPCYFAANILSGIMPDGEPEFDSYYLGREFKDEESAIELGITVENNDCDKIVRQDRSIDYNRFCQDKLADPPKLF